MSIGGGEGYGERERTGDDGLAYGHAQGRLTTRTRLPGGEGGSRPPTPRPGRSLVTVVGVVVLLIAAIAFANRGGDGSGDEGSDTPKGDEARPTAPTGKDPVQGSNAGVPSGFPHTEQGAQSAAANYAVALTGDGMFSPEKRQAIVKAVYAPSVAPERKDDLDKVYSDPGFLRRIGLKKDGSAPDGSTFIARTNPVGTKTGKYSDTKARVSVWYSSLFGLAGEGSKNPVSESWYTNTFDLTWVDSEWKVADFKQKDGPVPIGRDQRASSADEMADAVEGYGGFTYAR